LKPGHTFYVWVMDEECFNYKRNMSVLWLYYVSIMYILLPFWVDWLGCVKHLQFQVLVYSLCTCYVICFVNYVCIMNLHNELWIFIMHYGFS
jgi:hypothetical protein